MQFELHCHFCDLGEALDALGDHLIHQDFFSCERSWHLLCPCDELRYEFVLDERLVDVVKLWRKTSVLLQFKCFNQHLEVAAVKLFLQNI